MAEPVQLGPIGQISRTVGDIAASTAWYRDILGLPHLYSFGDLAFFDCGGVRLYLQQKPQPSLDEAVIYFEVPDITAAHAMLRDRGVALLGVPHLIHKHENGIEEWMTFFADLEGRPLAIMAKVGG